MATGDTIAGVVEVYRVHRSGAEIPVAGEFRQDAVDYHNNSVSPEEKLYINTSKTQYRTKPMGAQEEVAPGAQFFSGEVLRVKHQADSLEEAADYDDADAFGIQVVEQDKNRGTTKGVTLTVQDQELSSNPTSSSSDLVTIFEATVPDDTEWRLAGEFQAIATEVS